MSEDGISVDITADVAGLVSNIGKAISELTVFEGVAGIASVAALGIFANQAVDAAVGFEDALSTVTSRANLAQNQMGALREIVQEVGATSAGSAFTNLQLAQSMVAVARDGRTAADMGLMLDAAAKLATATHTDLATAVGIVDKQVTAMGGTSRDAAKVSDILTTAWTHSGGSLQDLGANLVATSQTAKTFGLTLEENAAVLSLLDEHGGSVRGLQSAFEGLLKPSKETKAVFESLGVSLVDARGAMRPILDVIKDVNDRSAALGLTSQETGQLMDKAFGAQGGKAVNALRDHIGELTLRTNEFSNSAGEAGRKAEESMNGADGQFKVFKATLANLTEQIGTLLLPVVILLLEAITALFHFVNDNIGILTFLGVTIGAIAIAANAAAVGQWLLNAAWGAAAIAVGVLDGALVLLDIAMAPITLVILAIAAAVFLVYEAWKHWNDIVPIAEAVFEYIKTGARVLLAVLTGGLSEVVIYFVQHFSEIREAASHLPQAIVDGIGDIGAFIWSHISGGLHNVAENVTQWAKGHLGLSPTLTEIGSYIPGAIADGVGDAGKPLWAALSPGLHDTAEKVRLFGRDLRAQVMDSLGGQVDTDAAVYKDTGGHYTFGQGNVKTALFGDVNVEKNGDLFHARSSYNGQSIGTDAFESLEQVAQRIGISAMDLANQLAHPIQKIEDIAKTLDPSDVNNAGFFKQFRGGLGPIPTPPAPEVHVTISSKDNLPDMISTHVETRLLRKLDAAGF